MPGQASNQDVDILLSAEGTPAEVFAKVRRAAPAGPLRLQRIEARGPGRWECRFVPQRTDLVVSYQSILHLQAGLSAELDLLRVSRASALEAA